MRTSGANFDTKKKHATRNQPGSANCHQLGASDHPWCSHFQSANSPKKSNQTSQKPTFI